MLDLSNNNSRTQDFRTAYVKGGQRRVYFKRCQGVTYTDDTFDTFRKEALAAGLKVGAYDFLEPLKASPEAAAKFLLDLLPPLKAGRDLRPCLDVEYGTATAAVGVWVAQVAKIVQKATGVQPLIYGSGYFLQDCGFKTAPGPLWLAAYGRNDGKQYPVEMLPKPWARFSAHQYTSNAHVVGITGACDLSNVAVPADVEIPRS